MDLGPVMTEAESDQLLAKVSTESGSRRSSSGESHSVDRSSSNDSPSVEECAKKGVSDSSWTSVTDVVPLRYSCV